MSRPTTDLILAIANETADSEALRDAIVRAGAADPANVDVVVVAPALNTRLRHWASDDDRARREAEKRLDRCVRSLHDRGLAAGGWVGDADPLLAIEDALHIVAADRIVIATHPEARSNWLARDVVAKARERFDLPVAHVVVGEGVALAAA